MTITSGMDRRDLLQRALLLLGAAVLPGGAEALAAAAQPGPRQLDPGRYLLLTSVADTIIPRTDTPGAVDAAVPERLDALLRDWAAPARRVELTAALDEIDKLARDGKGKPFVELAPAERQELLAPHDAASLRTAPPSKSGPAQPRSLMAGPAYVNPGYGKLKELIVVLYYISEPALTKELEYAQTPGRWQPSIPVTADTRPSGGIASI